MRLKIIRFKNGLPRGFHLIVGKLNFGFGFGYYNPRQQ